MGAPIAWAGGDARGQRTLGAIRKALASVGRAAQEAPPALDPVKPTGGDRDEDLVDARVGRQPVADGSAGVARGMVAVPVPATRAVVAIRPRPAVPLPRPARGP